MDLLKIYHALPTPLQNLALSIYGYKLRNERYGLAFKDELNRISKIEFTSIEEANVYQFNKLKNLVEYANKNIPFYQNLYKGIFDMGDFNSFDDYYKLPIIDKQFVMKHIDDFSLKNHNRKDLVKAKTGGTTGTALKFYYEKDTLAKEYAHVFAKSRYGYKPTDKHATFNGRIIVPSTQQSPPFWRENKAINQTLYSGYHLKEENLEFYVKDILKKEPIYITGYPSHIYIVADFIVRKSINIQNPPERIFTSSETISPQQRRTIETAFKCKIFDFYGQGEKVSQIYQCEYGNYHYVLKYGVNEIINVIEDQNTITGELVSTGFLNFASPFIRYRTGDFITISKNEVCSCGAIGPVIKSIDGRVEDIILLNDGRKIGRLDHIFKDTVNIKEGQIIQDNKDELIFNIVKRELFTQEDEKHLLKNIEEYIGTDMKINIQYVDSIPREKNGKFRAVKSKLKHNET